LDQYRKKNKSIVGFPGAESYKDDEAFFKACDFLIPAAVEKSVNKFNAERINCKILAEAANGPTTVGGEQILTRKGVQILPDILLNAGGVTCSYFEWLKNLEHKELGLLIRRWETQSKKQLFDMLSSNFNQKEVDKLKGPSERDLVYSGLEEIMCNTMKNVIDVSQKEDISLRIAAYKIAIMRVHNNYQDSGVYI